MDIHGALIDGGIAAARQLQQCFTGHHTTGPAHQGQEQVELESGELEHAAGQCGFTLAHVDFELSYPQALTGGVRCGAPHGAHAREQLTGTEGFREVVVSSNLEAHHTVGFVTARGEHHDGNAAALAHTTTHLESIEPRHGEVQEHDIEGSLLTANRRAIPARPSLAWESSTPCGAKYP